MFILAVVVFIVAIFVVMFYEMCPGLIDTVEP